jgi:DNA-binding NarL/FixJ family response regulator
MANLLKMAIVQSILSLHAQGFSARRIARTLGVNRETVSRYIR